MKRYNYPTPDPRFDFTGLFGLTLFYQNFEAAVDFYTHVLGPPAYAEGKSTRGWPLGSGWLTLLRGASGAAQNVEVTVQMGSSEEVKRLQRAFRLASGSGLLSRVVCPAWAQS